MLKNIRVTLRMVATLHTDQPDITEAELISLFFRTRMKALELPMAGWTRGRFSEATRFEVHSTVIEITSL